LWRIVQIELTDGSPKCVGGKILIVYAFE